MRLHRKVLLWCSLSACLVVSILGHIFFIAFPDDVKRSFDSRHAIVWYWSNDRLTMCGKVRNFNLTMIQYGIFLVLLSGYIERIDNGREEETDGNDPDGVATGGY